MKTSLITCFTCRAQYEGAHTCEVSEPFSLDAAKRSIQTMFNLLDSDLEELGLEDYEDDELEDLVKSIEKDDLGPPWDSF